MPSSNEDRSDRLLIIGWDGADWEILDDLVARGCLPNVAAMLDSGARGDLNSTIPSHSWAAWTTFLTGLNPGGHGIYDFVERRPHEPDKDIPVSSDSIKSPTFLERLSDAGHEVRAANIPVTFPPIPVKGRMIAGVAIPEGAEFEYPKEWGPELESKAPFPLNGMEWVHFEEDPKALVDEARTFIEQRTASFEAMLEGDWTVGVCVYVAPDRLQHALGGYLLPSHPEFETLSQSSVGQALRDVYTLLDEHILRLQALAGSNATTVLISDHGFRPVNRLASLNRILHAVGMGARSKAHDATSTLKKSSLVRSVLDTRFGAALKRTIRKPSEIDWAKTIAYQSVRGGGVSLNLEGREPQGVVARSDYERVRSELKEKLLTYVDPDTNERPVAEVLLSDELYEGDHKDLAPDMIVLSKDLWCFAHTDQLSTHTEWPTGAHRRKGIALASGGRVESGDLGTLDLADIPATALAFAGLPAGGLDGKPVAAIAGTLDEAVATQVSTGADRAAADLSSEEQDQIAEHLRSLGYIE